MPGLLWLLATQTTLLGLGLGEDGKQRELVVQVRDESGCGDAEVQDLRCSLKVEPTGLPDRSSRGCEKEECGDGSWSLGLSGVAINQDEKNSLVEVWGQGKVRNLSVDLLCLTIVAIQILFAECFEKKMKIGNI